MGQTLWAELDFSAGSGSGDGGNKIKQKRFCLNTRKCYFTVGVAQVAQVGCGVSLGRISSLVDSWHPWYVLVVSADVSGDGLEDSSEVASWLWKLGVHRVE